ncbi:MULTISPECIES: hypothetical protein [Bacillales]|uniref:Uncharacterized protein n=2 Tax=Guptibacillus hwajinpoensis TaxID=208199 RepID=A0A0J6CZ75_9BACL|nr:MULTISPECIES: hypothetical protein [Bacillaceae]KMM38413.1 hypothetical protein AB986_03680 [Alkalihalobacillus macyae]MBN8207685.1 hypothetical protein [Bacillus sp. NTK071]MDP4550053.1 hypothetical protein [Alkalihalobacillus macyae]MDQ0483127.1 hypothetical protein [Alkalihalobacillus hemicentroti]TKD71451.1 hypothetical protein FBF83_01160 [Pseudalkalibacillus hwajinpoensis]
MEIHCDGCTKEMRDWETIHMVKFDKWYVGHFNCLLNLKKKLNLNRPIKWDKLEGKKDNQKDSDGKMAP